MNAEDEARIIRLEELVAHQQSAIEEISLQLSDAWKNAEKLRRDLARLSDQLQDMEDNGAGPAANQPPPHW